MPYFTAVLARQGSGWRVLDLDVDDAEDLDELADLVRKSLPGSGPGLAIIEREDAWFAIVRVDEEGEPRPFVSDLPESLRSRYSGLLEAAADVDIPPTLDAEADLDLPTPQAVSAVDVRPVNDTDDTGDMGGTGDMVDRGDDEDDGDDDLAPDVTDDMDDSDDDEPDDAAISAAADATAAVDLGVADLTDPAIAVVRTWAGDPTLLEDLGLSASELVQLAVEESDDPAAALAGIGEAIGFDEQLDSMR